MQAERSGCIRAVVIDDHPVFAYGLKALMSVASTDIEVIAVATSVDRGVLDVQQLQPDIVAIGLGTPGGMDAAKKIRNVWPETKLLMFANRLDRQEASEALGAGVHGYLSRQVQPEYLIAAVREIAAGERVVGPKVAAAFLAEEQSSRFTLTDEETKLLKLVAAGLRTPEIAKEMAMSESSLRRRSRAVASKFEATNRIQAVVHAAKSGLI